MKKFILTLITALALSIGAVAQTWPPTDMNGNGSEANPYQIETHQHLKALSDYVSAANGIATTGVHYKLMNNIDLSSYANWTPIGDFNAMNRSFYGIFDGNGKTVSNLRSSNTVANGMSGLFGIILSGAVIKNLAVVNVQVESDFSAGGLLTDNRGTIQNCFTSGTVRSEGSFSAAGGISATLNGGTIENCYSTCDVEGPLYVGGITGLLGTGGTIKYCYATGNVKGNECVGGIVGGVMGGTLINCVAANNSVVALDATTWIGRVIGYTLGTNTISHNYALNTMMYQANGSPVTPVNDLNGKDGQSRDVIELKNSIFYSILSNWNGDAWDIANPNGIWKICNNENMLPFLRWQGILCDGEVGIETITNYELRITVFPNPTSGQLRITSYELQIEDIQIYDVMGKKILTSHVSQQSPETKFPSNSLERWQPQADGVVLNISHLPNGIYFLQIKTAQGLVNKKVIKN